MKASLKKAYNFGGPGATPQPAIFCFSLFLCSMAAIHLHTSWLDATYRLSIFESLSESEAFNFEPGTKAFPEPRRHPGARIIPAAIYSHSMVAGGLDDMS